MDSKFIKAGTFLQGFFSKVLLATCCGLPFLGFTQETTISFPFLNQASDVEVRYFDKPYIADKSISNATIINPNLADGILEFFIENPDTIAYADIWFQLKSIGDVDISGQATAGYLIEPGDQVTAAIVGHKVRFQGRGSDKYNLILERKQIQEKYNGREYADIQYEKHKNDSAYDEYQYWQGEKKELLALLKRYRKKLSPTVYKVLYRDFLASNQFRTMGSNFPLHLRSTIKEIRDKKLAMLDKYPDLFAFNGKLDHDAYSLLSREFLELAIYRCHIRYTLNTLDEPIDENDPHKGTREIYRLIKESYQGALRQKLIAKFVTQRHEVFQADLAFLEDALSQLQHTPYERPVADFFAVGRKGAPVLNFDLPDSIGRRYALNDFTGKVLVIDFWFTGCGGCKLAAKEIRDVIIPRFENDQRVVFLSVSIDGDVKTWKNTLKDEGLYPKSINLYTDGLRATHPLITTYGIKGYPRIMIIDANGRFFDSDAPSPSIRPGANDKFISLIHDALNVPVEVRN